MQTSAAIGFSLQAKISKQSAAVACRVVADAKIMPTAQEYRKKAVRLDTGREKSRLRVQGAFEK